MQRYKVLISNASKELKQILGYEVQLFGALFIVNSLKKILLLVIDI